MWVKPAIATAIVSVAAVACISNRFTELDRPIVISDVAIGLLDQTCGYRLTAASPKQRTVDVQLTIQARNTGLMDATFDPGGISLIAEGTELPAMATDETTIIRPGSARTFKVQFEGGGPVSCDGTMAVVLDRVLQPPSSRTAHHVLRFRGRALETRASPRNL